MRYFVMGDNQWRTSDSWPPAGARQRLLPVVGGHAPKRGGSGSPAPPAGTAAARARSAPNPDQSRDQPHALVRRPRLPGASPRTTATCSSFDSAPLDRDTELSGPIHARVIVSCDCRDTDLWVRLLDVAPDGAAHNLMSPGVDAVRASYRDLDKGRQLLAPDRSTRSARIISVTSNLFPARATGCGSRSPATFFPNFSRNLHTGEL